MKGRDEHDLEAYLWDPAAEPDGEVEALERALAPLRWKGAPPELPARRPARARGRIAAAAVAAVLAVAAWWTLRGSGEEDGAEPAYAYEVLRGSVQVDGRAVARRSGRLGRGQSLASAPDAEARLAVGAIGSVEVGPETRLRVDAPGAGFEGAEHVLYLEEGTLTASIFAAPRVFQLGTPSGIAVDMGCVYTTTVDAEGSARLAVDAGFVSFETPERRALVPAGASCRAWPGRGPGTPVWDGAPQAWRAAVDRLDAGGGSLEAPLAVVLATDDPADSLTLWHLLEHPDRAVRERVHDRLAALAPPPAGAGRAACLAGDRGALDAWRATFDWSW